MSSWQHGIRLCLDGKLGKARNVPDCWQLSVLVPLHIFAPKESAIFFSTSYPLPSPSRANLYSNETCEWARYLVKQ